MLAVSFWKKFQTKYFKEKLNVNWFGLRKHQAKKIFHENQSEGDKIERNF